MHNPTEQSPRADTDSADDKRDEEAPSAQSGPLLAPQTLALGRRIADELGGDTASLLSRWIAFRIAELMEATKEATTADARAQAEAACTELILRVWQERSNWPDGWPPHGANAIVEALRERPSWQRASVPDVTAELGWTEALPAIIESLDLEREIWLLAALDEQDPNELTSWLDQDGATINEDEKDTLVSVRDAARAAPDDLRKLLSALHSLHTKRAIRGRGAVSAGAVLQSLQAITRSRIKIAQQIVASSKLHNGT